jgi:hypothetical protein
MLREKNFHLTVTIFLTAMALLVMLPGRSRDKVFGDPKREQDAPVLTHPHVEPSKLSYKGGIVSLRVTVADEQGVKSARAEVMQPDRNKTIVNLTLKTGSATDGTWEGKFAAPMNNTKDDQTYEVIFFAQNVAGKEAASADLTFMVATVDITPPALYNPKAEPSKLSPMGGDVRLRVIATDENGVTSAQALVTKPDGGKATIDLLETMEMSSTPIGIWEGTFRAPMNKNKTEQTYKVIFSAKDAAQNQATSAEITFTVGVMADIRPPGPIPVSHSTQPSPQG